MSAARQGTAALALLGCAALTVVGCDDPYRSDPDPPEAGGQQSRAASPRPQALPAPPASGELPGRVPGALLDERPEILE